MTHSVYLILNDKDPEYLYVGTSVNPHHRFIKHCSKSSRCRRLKNAIKKHGRENFRMVIVFEGLTPEVAYEYEVKLIGQLLADGHKLYNLTAGGHGAPGRTVRKRTREKISVAMKRVRNEGRPGNTDSTGREDGVDVQRFPVEDSGEGGQAPRPSGIPDRVG